MPDQGEIQRTLQLGRSMLEAALTEVIQSVTSKLAGCQATANDATNCISGALTDALRTLYGTYYGTQQVVKDNLGYLLSAAGQYASLLGYPGVNVDPSAIPSDVSRTMDVNTGTGRNLSLSTVPVSPGQATVVPRDVGWSPGDIPVPASGSYDAHIGQQLDSTGQPVAQSQLLPIQGGLPTLQMRTAGSTSETGAVSPGPSAPITPQSISPVSTGSISPVSVSTGEETGAPTSVGNVPLPVPMPGQLAQGKGAPAIQRSIKGGPSLPVAIQGGAPQPVGTPTASGCPTTLTGLPSWTDLQPYGTVYPRNGMWIACGVVAAQITTDKSKADQGNVCYSATVDGVNYYGVVDPACPINQPAPPQVIPPVEPGPPATPPNKCPPANVPQSQYTPWQIANCTPQVQTGTIEKCPAPVVQCPSPTISMGVDLSALCACLKKSMGDAFPVDTDEPLAFKFAPDDQDWKAQALLFGGPALVAWNEAESVEQVLSIMDKGTPMLADYQDQWEV